MTLDYTMLGAIRDGRRVFFQFEIDDDWKDLQIGWTARTGMVIAFEYAQAQKARKSLVHVI